MCRCSGLPCSNHVALCKQATVLQHKDCSGLLSCSSAAKVPCTQFSRKEWRRGVGNILKLWAQTQGRDGAGQTSWASLPQPSPLALPHLLRSWVESGAASAGPGWHWHCISSGPALSPPLPSAKAPAVLACSSKLQAKPAVESTALAHGGLIPVSRGRTAPTAASKPTGLCWVQGCAHRSPGAHPTREARVLWDQDLGGCASLTALVQGCGCAEVLPGHVADAHECPMETLPSH